MSKKRMRREQVWGGWGGSHFLSEEEKLLVQKEQRKTLLDQLLPELDILAMPQDLEDRIATLRGVCKSLDTYRTEMQSLEWGRYSYFA